MADTAASGAPVRKIDLAAGIEGFYEFPPTATGESVKTDGETNPEIPTQAEGTGKNGLGTTVYLKARIPTNGSKITGVEVSGSWTHKSTDWAFTQTAPAGSVDGDASFTLSATDHLLSARVLVLGNIHPLVSLGGGLIVGGDLYSYTVPTDQSAYTPTGTDGSESIGLSDSPSLNSAQLGPSGKLDIGQGAITVYLNLPYDFTYGVSPSFELRAAQRVANHVRISALFMVASDPTRTHKLGTHDSDNGSQDITLDIPGHADVRLGLGVSGYW